MVSTFLVEHLLIKISITYAGNGVTGKVSQAVLCQGSWYSPYPEFKDVSSLSNVWLHSCIYFSQCHINDRIIDLYHLRMVRPTYWTWYISQVITYTKNLVFVNKLWNFNVFAICARVHVFALLNEAAIVTFLLVPHLKVPLKCSQLEPDGLLWNRLGGMEPPNVGALRDTVFLPWDKIS